MALPTESERLDKFKDLSLRLNANLPTDIYLKGNGEIWATLHGNEGVRPRKLTKEEVISYLWAGIDAGNKMISI